MISDSVYIVSYVNSVYSRLKGHVIRKLLLVAGCWLLIAFSSLGQTTGDFRTNGDVTFSVAGNWQRYNGVTWVAAGAAPVSTDGVITIRNGNTATLTASKALDQLVVAGGGILAVNSGQTLTINNGPGTDLDVTGTINNSGTISPTGSIVFNSSSIYNHTQNGGTIPIAVWDPSSNCNITGITSSTGFTGGLEGQTFGNFTWNCIGQTSNFYLASNFNVAGNFSVLGTGSFDSNYHVLRMSEFATPYTINVSGSFVINNNSSFKMNNGTGSCIMNIGGNFTLNSGYFTIVTGAANSTLSVTGNLSILGGTLSLHEDNSSTVGTLNVRGNFTLAGSGSIIIDNISTGLGVVNFNGSTAQTYSNSGGTILNAINFAVLSGSILDVGTSVINGSTGTFTLNSGAGIITANIQGLSTTPGTGSIQVTGTKSFNTGADYTYNGSGAQVTGNALPSTVHNLTINNLSGVSLTNGVSISNLLTMMSGNITTGANTLTDLNPAFASLNYTSGIIIGPFERFINQTSQPYLFPVGISSQIHSCQF